MPCCTRCGSYASQRLKRPLHARILRLRRRYFCFDCETVFVPGAPEANRRAPFRDASAAGAVSDS
ncbi:hypothetical protein [Salinicola rhizosphaerae]|uniref:Uncharacterized protein n=1 Tax=Salinicola rhizosphaerae TaxID=1443141 RepID=A0ABQ3DZB3_9GAMM|nr:hypothetical protein [Salinicola rhizosphaerae]GHB20547.1 hypothetical protein GCM10009038_19130 [Salinicola rhizosphaerae]